MTPRMIELYDKKGRRLCVWPLIVGPGYRSEGKEISDNAPLPTVIYWQHTPTLEPRFFLLSLDSVIATRPKDDNREYFPEYHEMDAPVPLHTDLV